MKNSPENVETSPPENLLCLRENQSSERKTKQRQWTCISMRQTALHYGKNLLATIMQRTFTHEIFTHIYKLGLLPCSLARFRLARCGSKKGTFFIKIQLILEKTDYK